MASGDGLASSTDTSGWDAAFIPEDEIQANDVILGRGKSNIKHPGNTRYHEIINQQRERYFAATTNQDKKDITELILIEIDGRFIRLNRDDSGGIAISKKDARIKIAQSLQYRQRQVLEKKAVPTAAVTSSTTTNQAKVATKPSSNDTPVAVPSAEREPMVRFDVEPISFAPTAAYNASPSSMGIPSPMVFPPQQQGIISTAPAGFHPGLYASGQPATIVQANDDMRWASAAQVPSWAMQVSSPGPYAMAYGPSSMLHVPATVATSTALALGANQSFHSSSSHLNHEEDDEDEDDAIGIAFDDLQRPPPRYQGF